MKLIVAIAIYIFVLIALIAFVRGAGGSRKPRNVSLTRRFDAYYRKHSNICFAWMLFVCAIVLYVAYTRDADNTAQLELQMMVKDTRGTT